MAGGAGVGARLLVLNDDLAAELGLDADALRTPDGRRRARRQRPLRRGADPVAQAYAGHQFGGYSPRLGDGRALLLGEVVDVDGRRRDLHLKGSGRTPFARGGDGKAAVGPMLREYVIGEAMHALGIPTTRALAVVATGERRRPRDDAARGGARPRRREPPPRRHVPVRGRATTTRRSCSASPTTPSPATTRTPPTRRTRTSRSSSAVVDAQASLVARWMLVGFIHGVMNTDNMTISGETIDYGPCAFMDAYDPATVFSSIDHGGRYAYGNQPPIAQWNLARLAETLLPLFDDDVDAAVEVATERAPSRSPTATTGTGAPGCGAKLGLAGDRRPPATTSSSTTCSR